MLLVIAAFFAVGGAVLVNGSFMDRLSAAAEQEQSMHAMLCGVVEDYYLDQTGNDLEELIGTRSRAITRKLESVQQLEPTEAADLLGLAEGGSRISTQNSEIDRQDNAPRLRRKDDAGMPM